MQPPEIETCNSGDKIFWQNDEENGVGEPALLIQKYSNVVTINMGNAFVNINYDTIPALTKYLNFLYREKTGEVK